MTHLQSSTHSQELDNILDNLSKKKIPYKIKIREGLIIELDTKDKELIKFAKKNNSDLK